ncbi:GNAT family N-acetyltransferase [Denitrobaculum tricleocarpae]|uniref:GNAT family N-acetyltransferase n=1 Tax=Denitrobaculum tricleocarpae TaxID=2591009 RepID=A0A545TL43_9PROT|nr:GNAT family N-acetyltransferase [Denitrobaculum tricleocarpae]TQV77944.1 GNAT family N-acetyltransferase [Denitrobaculum tricleocarpae]
MALEIRPATQSDANAMARLLNEIISIGGSTAYRQPFDTQGIMDTFVSPKRGISCFVAVKGSQLLGFQALEWADPDWPGEEPLPPGWALIATYVDPHAHKQGVGRALFAQTAAAAKGAGVGFIDATIRKENTGGQAYYQGVGFRDYKADAETVSKVYAPA